MSTTTKAKRKQYFSSKANKKPKYGGVNINMKGFLCSCNNREKDCMRESYNLLNKYADLLYPTVNEPSTTDDNVEDSLAKEIEALKSKEARKFQQRESGAKNFLFIETTLENPLELATSIVNDISNTKEQQTRFLIRIIPVEITCKAFPEDIKVALEPLVKKHFENTTEKTFAVVYNHRNNNSLNRDEITKEAADLVTKLERNHKVNLSTPEISIIIEVIKSFAFLSVVPDYTKYKKFNLHNICSNQSVVKST